MLDDDERGEERHSADKGADDSAVAPRKHIAAPGETEDEARRGSHDEDSAGEVEAEEFLSETLVLLPRELEGQQDHDKADGADDQVDPEAPPPGSVSGVLLC